MLHQTADFPFAGSTGFERGSARPVTVIQHRGDGRVLVRRDDVSAPGASLGGTALGNATLDFADLVASAEAASRPARKPRSRRVRK